MRLAKTYGMGTWMESWRIKIFITDSQSECDPRNKFLDTLRKNYEYNFPFYCAASPKTLLGLLVLLGKQGIKMRRDKKTERAIFLP